MTPAPLSLSLAKPPRRVTAILPGSRRCSAGTQHAIFAEGPWRGKSGERASRAIAAPVLCLRAGPPRYQHWQPRDPRRDPARLVHREAAVTHPSRHLPSVDIGHRQPGRVLDGVAARGSNDGPGAAGSGVACRIKAGERMRNKDHPQPRCRRQCILRLHAFVRLWRPGAEPCRDGCMLIGASASAGQTKTGAMEHDARSCHPTTARPPRRGNSHLADRTLHVTREACPGRPNDAISDSARFICNLVDRIQQFRFLRKQTETRVIIFKRCK